jgi:hypothetical protein
VSQDPSVACGIYTCVTFLPLRLGKPKLHSSNGSSSALRCILDAGSNSYHIPHSLYW